MSKITYKEYKENRQKDFNALPIFWAFSNEQFKEECNKRGFEPEKAREYLYSLGAGGYYLKADAPIIHDYMNKPDEIHELMKDEEFAESAFYYEMGNYEYHINNWQGNYDVLSCFGKITFNDDDSAKDYFKELNFEPQTIQAFYKARKRFLTDAAENDWY